MIVELNNNCETFLPKHYGNLSDDIIQKIQGAKNIRMIVEEVFVIMGQRSAQLKFIE